MSPTNCHKPRIISLSSAHLYPYGGAPAGLPFKPSVNGIIGWQKQSKQYDFVVNHMTYNFTFADDYLPTAKKISILRHPASLMTSTWKYYFNSLVTEKEIGKTFQSLNAPCYARKSWIIGTRGNRMCVMYFQRCRMIQLAESVLRRCIGF